MATFVISHGGWGGGWEWTPVARQLRQRGHEVYTPTLTGLGERSHVRPSEVTLSDHIEDILGVFTFEQLDDVILCGHSYSGMVVSGVADRIADRLRLLVHLDSFAPRDGQSLRELAPELTDALLQAGEERGDNRAPIPAELLPPEEERDARINAYVERLCPQSVNTMTEPVRLSGAIDRVPRAYVRCTGYDDEMMAPFAARAQDEGWIYRELETEHDLQLFDPEGTVEILAELAAIAEYEGAATR